MFDTDRFKSVEVFTARSGDSNCCICGKRIKKDEKYMEDKAGYLAHIDCITMPPLLACREDSKVDPNHYTYSAPLSLYASLSKAELKNGSDGKQILLTFEVLLRREMNELVEGLGINLNDFFPGDDEKHPKYQQAVLDSGVLCESTLFLEWLSFDCTGELNKIIEIGHVQARAVKIITKTVKEIKLTLLSLQAEVENQDIGLLNSAYYDLGHVVIFKLRVAEWIKSQQELPLGDDPQGQEMSAEGQGMAAELDEKLGLKQEIKPAKEPEVPEQPLPAPPVPEKTCKEPGCEITKLYARGYCRKHWKKHVGAEAA